MSKYYRELTNEEAKNNSGGWAFSKTINGVPVEVSDPWHPASDPPKPEDFEPTGVILVRRQKSGRDAYYHLTGIGITQPQEITHWLKITPPTKETIK